MTIIEAFLDCFKPYGNPHNSYFYHLSSSKMTPLFEAFVTFAASFQAPKPEYHNDIKIKTSNYIPVLSYNIYGLGL